MKNGVDDSQEKFEVEGILREREWNGKSQYLVWWAESFKPSWEPAHVIERDCPSMVKEFLKVRKVHVGGAHDVSKYRKKALD